MDRKPIKIGIIGRHTLNYLPIHVAAKLGVFYGMRELFRYNVDLIEYPNYDIGFKAMLNEDCDYWVSMTSDLLRARIFGKTLVGLLNFGLSPGATLMVRADKTDINNPGALKGRTIGVVADRSPHLIALMGILRGVGLTPADIKIKWLGSVDKIPTAFRDENPPELLMCDEPLVSAFHAAGMAKPLIDLYDANMVGKIIKAPFAGGTLSTTRNMISHNFNEVRNITGAVARVVLRIYESTDPVTFISESLPAYFDKFSKSIGVSIKKTLAAGARDGLFTPESVGGIIATMKAVGQLPADFDYSPQVFYDNTVYINRKSATSSHEEIDLEAIAD